MKTWYWWTIAATVLWGLWGVATGKAARYGTAWGVMAGAVVVEALVVLPRWTEISKSLSWWMIAAGVTGAAAYISMFKAFETGGPTSTVVMLTATYPVITYVLALVVLGEAFAWRRMLALVLVIGAAALLHG